MNLALFDFDGTLTMRDSLTHFIQYAVGKPAFYYGLVMLSPILAAYLMGAIPNHVAKQRLLSWFFKGWQVDRFKSLANAYSQYEIAPILRPAAIEKLHWHQRQGDRVVVISASIEDWLCFWCEFHQIELVSTQLEFVDGKLTGKFATPNCHGKEKVNRIKSLVDLSTFDKVFAYGDSRGDREMLEIADEAFYRRF